MTIGSATVNYPVLSNLKDADALREMAMGKAVAEAAFHRDVRHFAYPFGDRDAWRRAACRRWRRRPASPARSSAIPGVVEAQGLHQSARAAARRLGRTAALAAHDARDAVRSMFAPVQADQATLGARLGRSGRDIQLMIGIAGSTQPRPATT